MGLRLDRSASNGTTLAPVAAMIAPCARTLAITVTSKSIDTAARAIGRKCDAKNQSSVAMKARRRGTHGDKSVCSILRSCTATMRNERWGRLSVTVTRPRNAL
ncbi:hypothetical protein KHHGKMAE_3896 [Methylobacterium persicinum]|nr:hypothetical protein KHHGKMAE_3896 [Methylobacterium persicinum]